MTYLWWSSSSLPNAFSFEVVISHQLHFATIIEPFCLSQQFGYLVFSYNYSRSIVERSRYSRRFHFTLFISFGAVVGQGRYWRCPLTARFEKWATCSFYLIQNPWCRFSDSARDSSELGYFQLPFSDSSSIASSYSESHLSKYRQARIPASSFWW